MAEAFNSAAIGVVPSLWDEPFGRAALEGMAEGCAVIASNRSGLPEVVGDAGIFFEPTADCLAAGLDALMSDTDCCTRVGADCVACAHSIFEPAAINMSINKLRAS